MEICEYRPEKTKRIESNLKTQTNALTLVNLLQAIRFISEENLENSLY